MVWDIPSTKQEKNVTFPRPKVSLSIGINILKTTQATESFCKQRPTESCRTRIFFLRNGKKLNTLKILNTSFFEDIY